jgi:hypothetical protein
MKGGRLGDAGLPAGRYPKTDAGHDDPPAAALRSSSIKKRRAFLSGGAAAVAGLAGGPALLDWRGERQGRELSASAVPAAPGRDLASVVDHRSPRGTR